MTEEPSQQAVVLKLEPSPLRLQVQNLRTGEQKSFSNWADLMTYLQTLSQHKGLR